VIEQPNGEQRYSAPIGALSPTLDATFFALSDLERRGLTLNGIKKHVGTLELAGLVETEKVGRARECRLDRCERLVERSG
jgi:hypothetical protein